MVTFQAVRKSIFFKLKLLWLLFGQFWEREKWAILFQHLVTQARAEQIFTKI